MREISICNELTKLNELVIRGTTKEIHKIIEEKKLNFKGEFVVILSPPTKKNKKKLNTKIQMQISKLLKKYSLTETVRIVHNLTEISKNDIYKMTIQVNND